MASARSILGLSVAAGLTAWLALAPRCGLAYDGCCCCYVCYGTPIVSALDEPLRCYFVPRQPGWPETDYCYRVEGPKPCPGCGPGGGNEMDAPCGGGELPFPQELAEHFTPWEFERLGQIPGDSLLEASPVPSR
jgi:hypothetical protein